MDFFPCLYVFLFAYLLFYHTHPYNGIRDNNNSLQNISSFQKIKYIQVYTSLIKFWCILDSRIYIQFLGTIRVFHTNKSWFTITLILLKIQSQEPPKSSSGTSISRPEIFMWTTPMFQNQIRYIETFRCFILSTWIIPEQLNSITSLSFILTVFNVH